MIAVNDIHLRSRSDDEANDQFGSQSATPSGIATPQPDPVDKRLPGIEHSFFGQVGASSIRSPKDRSKSTSCGASGESVPKENVISLQGDYLPPTAPCSPQLESGSEQGQPRQAELAGDLPTAGVAEEKTEHRSIVGYPTPPESSSSSIMQKEEENGEKRQGSTGQCARRESDAASQQQESAAAQPPRPSRRHTAGIKSLSNIVIGPPVLASSVVQTTSVHASTVPSTPTRSKSQVSALSCLTASLASTKLTDGVAETPCEKSTPPQTPNTPRALSKSNGTEPARSTPARSSNTTQSSGAEANGSSVSSTSPTLTGLKGKLFVNITEARGLRPSYDPYIVCVFEWNEYISKGPKTEESAPDSADFKPSREELLGGVPIKRSISDMGRSIAIPMKSRQSSTTSLTEQKNQKPGGGKQVTDPKWEHEAIFDVAGKGTDVDFYVYDRSDQEKFLGHVRVPISLADDHKQTDGWYKLESRDNSSETVTGEIHVYTKFEKTDKKHYGPEDFQILKLIGKGTFGQVYQVRKKDTGRIYAMKVLSKKVIVQKKEVAHTLGERNILVRTAMSDSLFIVGLKFSFQTPTDLYLVTDFMSGGELFWHLQKEGRFNETRAKFYIAELILALQHLHQHDIVYRDLKPENILLDANGHIALCDFGLSKANLTKDATTNTFCGTTEYLAPEVLLDEQGYTTMVDFWSLGVLVFEMCCGWSPFYAEDTQQMYKNIAFGKVRFPRDALSTEGRNFVKGLLNRNPKHRLGATKDAEELKEHPFFADIDWDALSKKLVVPPFKPKLKSNLDTSNFDPEFTNALNTSSSLNARAAQLANGQMPASTPLSPGMQANFKGFTFVDESSMDENFRGSEHDRMDEDSREDEHWDHSDAHRKREDRMSGVVKTTSGDDFFSGEQFE